MSQLSMSGIPYTDIAASAFRAYKAFTSDLNFKGNRIPAWEDLPQKIRDAWEVAIRQAEAVMTNPDSAYVKNENRWANWQPPCEG